MRTTVPLLYNLEGKVDGLDVIDFPGVDDDDHTTVPELADLLLSLAQIVVFVVDYRLVHNPLRKQVPCRCRSAEGVLLLETDN